MDEKYLKQVELVVKVLNHIEKENCFDHGFSADGSALRWMRFPNGFGYVQNPKTLRRVQQFADSHR